jgi:hypothetical protein
MPQSIVIGDKGVTVDMMTDMKQFKKGIKEIRKIKRDGTY